MQSMQVLYINSPLVFHYGSWTENETYRINWSNVLFPYGPSFSRWSFPSFPYYVVLRFGVHIVNNTWPARSPDMMILKDLKNPRWKSGHVTVGQRTVSFGVSSASWDLRRNFLLQKIGSRKKQIHECTTYNNNNSRHFQTLHKCIK